MYYTSIWVYGHIKDYVPCYLHARCHVYSAQMYYIYTVYK